MLVPAPLLACTAKQPPDFWGRLFYKQPIQHASNLNQTVKTTVNR
jgi:hypothetical protein